MTLVIWVNCYTGHIDGGYWMFTQSKRKSGNTLTRLEVLDAIRDPDARIEFLSV